MAIVRLGAPALILALLVAACQPAGRTFQVTLPGNELNDPLPVALVDQTDLVTSIAPAVVDATIGFEPALRVDQTEPNTVLLTWMGGVCDAQQTVTLSIHDGTFVMQLDTREKPGGGCPMAGVPRGIRVATSSPLPVESVVIAGN